MKWFRNLSVKAKLMSSFGLLLAVTSAIGYQGIRVALALNGRIETMYSRDVAGLVAVKDVEVDKALIARCSRNAILATGKPEEIAAQEKDFQKQFTKLQSDLALAEQRASNSEESAKLQNIRELLPAYQKSAQDIIHFAKAGNGDGAKAVLKNSGKGIIKQLNDAVGVAIAAKQKAAQAGRDLAEEEFGRSRLLMMGTLATAVGLGIGISLWLAQIFSAPLKAVVEMLRHVEAGDLSHTLTVQSNDEIGMMARSLNRAIGRIACTINEVTVASKSLSEASTQLASAADQLAGGTQQQAASLQQTSASLEEITATVRNNSDNAIEASKLASSSSNTASAGGGIMANAAVAMGGINTSATKITNIVNTVDEIAFKTNMLAVNAAIEAARAGEQGKGFAVVATEVRSLARQSSQASNQIRGLISDSLEKVKNGSELVGESGQALEQIVASISRVSGMIEEIAAASREQTLGIEQVNQAVTSMDRVMQRSASQTEEVSATAESVARQASHLEELVQQFTVS